MPYLPVDLDAKRKAHGIERALGLPRHVVAGGLTDLWEVVWRTWAGGKPIGVADVVDDLAMDETFGPDARIRGALVAREFLEPTEGGWRVRGAAKWLFGLEGKKRGGMSAKGNLNRGSKPGVLPGNAPDAQPDSPAMPGPMPGPMPEDTSRLNPRLLHPAPSTQHLEETIAGANAPRMDGIRAAGALEIPGLAQTAKPDRRKAGRPLMGQPPNPRHAPMVARLVAAFLELRGVAYAFAPRDAKALQTLLGMGADDEIDRRWRRGLQGQFRERCDTLADLLQRWNALTGNGQDPPGRAGGARDVSRGMVRAQDVDKSEFEKTGTVSGF